MAVQTTVTATAAQKLPSLDQKKNMKYLRDKDREMVRGKFIFHECPGALMEFSFKKWKEDPLETYHLRDGEIYSLPYGVAKHLNTNCAYPIHHYATDESGKPVAKIGQKVRRCSFQSLEFMDIEGLGPVNDIVTVETII